MAFPRAAVVIGVDRVKPMPPLSAAAAVATSVSAWLAREGYEVELLTDADDGRVSASQVEEAIGRFVTAPPRYRQLLIYFTGHGLWQGRADRWLLTDASRQSSQAINLNGAMELARYSGIDNVIFVSDACRSLPTTFGQAMVQGSDAFPVIDGIVRPSKVDVFKATTDARPAYEVPEPGGAGRTSVLSWALRRAFEAPWQDMVATVSEGGIPVEVVPNRRLERFLQETVDDVLSAIRPGLGQRIEAIVPSADDVYIARVSDQAQPAQALGGRRRRGGGAPAVASAAEHTEDLLAAAESGAVTPLGDDRLLPMREVRHFETECGLTVRGVALRDVLASSPGGGNTRIELLDHGGSHQAAIVRLYPAGPAGSLLLRFDDGRGAVVPYFRGYIAHVTVSAAGVSQIAFVPSDNSARWGDDLAQREWIDQLRAAIAEAVDAERFVLSGKDAAKQLADQLRKLKHLDPTLGLYAAHAYAQAGLFEQVRDVARHLREDLEVGLFDVELLGLRRGEPWTGSGIVPFCPLLSQTWSLLRARGVSLPGVLQQAQAHLCNALWTTFSPEGVPAIAKAMQEGEIA
jgi:hypothetical protein